MMRVALLLLITVSGLASDIASAKNRPVTKVINMMKDMQTELAKENDSDQEVYDTTVCWCETNDKAKTKAISEGEARINSLQISIEDLTERSAHLNTEIKNLEIEVANNEKALETGTALRRKQLAEFNAEEKDMLQSISSMKGAVTALSKHHEDAAFLQASSGAREKLMQLTATSIQNELKTHHALLAEVITPHQRKTVAAFLQTRQPQSGEIFGIINGMKDSFENNLSQSQAEETANDNAYEDMKKAKSEEIASGQTQLETKTQQLADTDEKNARDQQELLDTQATLEQDTVFLANLKQECSSVDEEFAARRKSRTLEIQAVGKALGFLTSDEAHDLFTRTFNNFVQKEQRATDSKRRDAVYKILMSVAQKSANPQLVILATRTRMAQFEVMKESLEKMIEPLIKEKEEEIAKRDFCIAELNTNEKTTAGKGRDKADAESAVEGSRMSIDELTREIAELTQTVADAEMQFKRAGEDRENENHEFQITVADQRATQKLLYGALKALKGFYGADLLQTSSRSHTTASQTPPGAGFKKTRSKGGILGVIQEVIDDAQKLEAEAIRDQEESQKAYEDFVKDTNDSYAIWHKALSNKKEAKAKGEVEKAGFDLQLDTAVTELKQLSKANDDLHAQCDFALKNFELRQATRDEEIGALKQSIAILGGSSFGAFLENLGR